ncbi:MAG: hypothetical protein H6811_02270 [Phycisphaeraceae bacterium]|nr:hypothetical protein [Phycisphaeraceae bacterium]
MDLTSASLGQVSDGVSAWRAFAQSVGRALDANADLAPVIAVVLIALAVLALDVFVARRIARRGERGRNDRS